MQFSGLYFYFLSLLEAGASAVEAGWAIRNYRVTKGTA